MRLLRQQHRVNAVARQRVAVHAVVVHREARPVGRQLEGGVERVGQRRGVQIVQLGRRQWQRRRDVVARRDELIGEHDGRDAVRVGDFARHGHLVGGSRRIRRVINLPEVRRGVRGEDGVRRARRGQRAAPRAAEVVVERRVHKLRRGAVPIRGDGPGEFIAIIHLVDDHAVRVAQGELLAVVVQSAAPGAERGPAVARENDRWIFRHDGERARAERRAGREEEIHPAAHAPLRDVEGRVGVVVKLDERLAHRIEVGVVVNLVDDDAARRIEDDERDILRVAQARAVGRTQAEAEYRPRSPGERRTSEQRAAANGELRVVPITRH